MDNQQIKETLEKQLQLLSERSAVALSENNLAEISKVILDIAVNLWKSMMPTSLLITSSVLRIRPSARNRLDIGK